MEKRLVKIFGIIFVIIFTMLMMQSVLATDVLLPSNPDCDCSGNISQECEATCKNRTGDYSLNDIVQVGVRATEILLGLTGSVALLMFIYGGVVFLISGGSPDKISQGKQIITNSVIGIVLIFSSFIIIQFSMTALGYTRTEIFGQWNQSN